MYFWNANGLTEEKLSRMELKYSRSDALMLAICETHHVDNSLAVPNSPTASSCRELHGFKAIRKPFAANSGGIAAFLRPELPVKPRPDLERSPHVLCLETRFPGSHENCIVMICYRREAEGSAGWRSLASSLQLAADTGLPLLALGDFNARLKLFGDSSDNHFGPLLDSLCDGLGLTVANTLLCPGVKTRKQSVLDLALTSDLSMITEMSVGGKAGMLSDHASLNLTLACGGIERKTRQKRQRWNFENADWPLFTQTLEDAAPGALAECQHLIDDQLKSTQHVVDDMVGVLSNFFTRIGMQTIGKKEVSTAPHEWWRKHPDLKPKCRSYEKAKRRDWRKSTAQSRLEVASAWCEWQNSLTVAREHRMSKIVEGMAAGNQVNWSKFNDHAKPRTTDISQIRCANGQPAATPQAALNSLAEHFADVCTLPEIKRPSEAQVRLKKEIDESIRNAEHSSCAELDKPFDFETIKKACRALKNPKSAAGPDEIPAVFLKHSSDKTIELLCCIFNYSWSNGVVPTQWREANVCGILKAGCADRGDRANYRPISLTSVVCKLFERLILARLWAKVGKKIHRLQFGFRSEQSTLDALLRLQRNIFRAFERRQHLSVAFLDISKAFDRTWHDGLLHKLHKIGITGNAWRWCRAFLADRKIRTVQDGLASDWQAINAGVPQGSVLSPFLFLVFINDIVDERDEAREEQLQGLAICDIVELILFADDIAVVPKMAGFESDRKLFKALTMLERWAVRWRLQFNAKKSKVLRFSIHRSKTKLKPRVFVPSTHYLNNEKLERVESFDYLGLRWQANGQWKLHLDKLCVSAKRVAGLIMSIITRNGLRLPVVRQLVHALLRTKITYGMPVWRANTEKAWRQLDVITTDPLRRCLQLPKSTFILSVLVETNTLSAKLHHEMSLVKLAQRAARLPAEHSTREVHDEQAGTPIVVRKRPPIFAAAASVIAHRRIDVNNTSKAELITRSQLWMRKDWRFSGKGNLLRELTGDDHEQTTGKLLLTEYLTKDTVRATRIRAKLRFDRSNLKDTLKRQNIIKQHESAACDFCDPLQRESLWHLLFACSLTSIERRKMKDAARAAELPTTTALLRHWLLGNVMCLPQLKRTPALSISALFLIEIDDLRRL